MCDRCERRFVQPVILEGGRCPLCDGRLVLLGELLFPEPLERRAEKSVRDNGNR